jgi:photosystem II stability/assembly factor-like uncharacterized protein
MELGWHHDPAAELMSVRFGSGRRWAAVPLLIGLVVVAMLGCAHENGEMKRTNPSASAPAASPLERCFISVLSPLGEVRVSDDGGATWRVEEVTPNDRPMAMTFADGAAGWAVSRFGACWSTTDTGSTWTQSTVDGTAVDVACSDERNVWIVGARQADLHEDAAMIWHSEDGGETWTSQDPKLTATLTGVAFASKSVGWAVGEDVASGTSYITGTADGGIRWRTQMTAPAFTRLGQIAFADELHGWAVGRVVGDQSPSRDSGVAYRTTDGGATWRPGKVFPEALMAVAFSGRTVCITGEGGFIGVSRNGGKSWSRSRSGTTQGVRAVAFVDRDCGFAITGDSGLLRTVDGGRTWTSIAYGEPILLMDVAARSK